MHQTRLDMRGRRMHGPRRAGMAQIARLADTNRPFLCRNWAGRDALIREATRLEPRRLLFVAREVPDTLPPRCRQVRFVVRAARLLREHPVVGAMARTDPELVHAAILRPVTDWHTTARLWLREHVTGHITAPAERDSATLAVLTTALPYALTPSTNPSAIDARLSTAVHLCLAVPTPWAAQQICSSTR
ncbi:hypothetical protein ACIBAG_13090 [Streptomyces sp. NPDC051243]|uniref:hypothetical protein n=1 Tax=Streptomyces sp. NPDC051243 TaxID=3365646 RepID=UPI00379BE703